MEENQLIENIRRLFVMLIEEEKDSYIPGTNYQFTLPPSALRYCKNAQELAENARELSALNPKYSVQFLDEVMRDEVSTVSRHEYKYEDGANTPTNKSKDELIGLMRDATYHIRLSLFEILRDMNI